MEQSSPSLTHDMMRGFRCRCPNCGEGKIFKSFLKVADSCHACGEEFHHHRADDFPAYIVIVIVGHIAVSLALALEEYFAPPFWWHFAITLPVTVLLCLGLLQPVKGAIVALQWHQGMHGFAPAKKRRLSEKSSANS